MELGQFRRPRLWDQVPARSVPDTQEWTASRGHRTLRCVQHSNAICSTTSINVSVVTTMKSHGVFSCETTKCSHSRTQNANATGDPSQILPVTPFRRKPQAQATLGAWQQSGTSPERQTTARVFNHSVPGAESRGKEIRLSLLYLLASQTAQGS